MLFFGVATSLSCAPEPAGGFELPLFFEQLAERMAINPKDKTLDAVDVPTERIFFFKLPPKRKIRSIHVQLKTPQRCPVINCRAKIGTVECVEVYPGVSLVTRLNVHGFWRFLGSCEAFRVLESFLIVQ